ncbi:MAG: sugar-binding protein [Verrucomicrobiae bacterium]|nr:sugar-binding protein [Verrucomicrobiae bacterium]
MTGVFPCPAQMPKDLGEGEKKTLWNCNFEQKDAVRAWSMEEPDGAAILTAATDRPGEGKGYGRLEFKRFTCETTCQTVIPCVPCGKFKKAKIRVSLLISSSVGGEMALWESDGQQERRAFTSMGEQRVVLPAAAQWSPVQTEWVLRKNTKSLRLCLVAEGGGPQSRFWIDAVTVESETAKCHEFESTSPGFVFIQDSGMVEVLFADADRMSGADVTVHDEEQNILKELNAPAKAQRLRVDLPSRGYYSIEVSARYEGNAELLGRGTAVVAGKPPPEIARKTSRYGLFLGEGDPALAAGAGARWTLRGWNARSFRLGPDGGFLMGHQTLAPDVKGALDVVGEWRGLPCWLMPPGASPGRIQSPIDPALLEKMVQGFARACSPFPGYFVPQEMPETNWGGLDKDMVAFYRQVAKMIKTAHPAVKVLGPGIHASRMPYLRKLVRDGLLKDLDGVALHLDRSNASGVAPEGEFYWRMTEARRFLDAAGQKDCPLFLMGFGWQTSVEGAGTGGAKVAGSKTLDELNQAQYVSRAMALLSMAKVDGYVYSSLLGGGMDGVLRPDGTPRPAYASFANALRWLNGGDGEVRWLRLTPTLNLLLYPKGKGVVAVVWNSDAKVKMNVPLSARRVEEMNGRAMASIENAPFEIGQSPVFMELTDGSLAGVTLQDGITLRQGTRKALPWKNAIVHPPLIVKDDQVEAPVTAVPGTYLALVKTETGWRGAPVRVVRPMVIESSGLTWPLDEDVPQVQINVRSHLDAPVKGQVAIKPGADPEIFSDSIDLVPQKVTAVSIPLANCQPGKFYGGKVTLNCQDASRLHVEGRFGANFLGCFSLFNQAERALWDKIPPVDLSNMGGFRTGAQEVALPGATLKMGYSDMGLYFQVEVMDERHVQGQAPRDIWKEDSLQFAFDPDLEKPWQPGSQEGLDGHRLLEYGVALGAKGPAIWRWISYDPRLLEDTAEPKVMTQLKRKDSSTWYEIIFPWDTLGLQKRPDPGAVMGFALAVNDFDDGETGRHGVRYFRGVMDSKDPSSLGKIWFRGKAKP